MLILFLIRVERRCHNRSRRSGERCDCRTITSSPCRVQGWDTRGSFFRRKSRARLVRICGCIFGNRGCVWFIRGSYRWRWQLSLLESVICD